MTIHGGPYVWGVRASEYYGGYQITDWLSIESRGIVPFSSETRNINGNKVEKEIDTLYSGFLKFSVPQWSVQPYGLLGYSRFSGFTWVNGIGTEVFNGVTDTSVGFGIHYPNLNTHDAGFKLEYVDYAQFSTSNSKQNIVSLNAGTVVTF